MRLRPGSAVPVARRRRIAGWLAAAVTAAALGFGIYVAGPAAAAPSQWLQVSAGAFHTCGLTDAGIRYCWGANHHYELGLGDQQPRLEPAKRSADGPWLAVDAGDRTSCGVSSGHRVYCWGQNTYGHAGSGNTQPQAEPVQVKTSSATVSSGGLHACLVRTDGTLHCWGGNDAGRLGDGTTTNRYTPQSVSSQAPAWSSVSAGGSHTCGIRTDKTLYCWGYNGAGQLGDGTRTSRRTPVLVA
jgi:alpha-tubulin suppressor-like RCC1 family protein